jgi:predicted HTH domain antitoxin
MVKTVSVAELGHGRASRAVHDSAREPVLVTRENKPVAWIVSAAAVAEVAAARGVETDVSQHALELLAVELYRQEVLTLGQAARLVSMSLGEFIDLVGRLRVPVLWEPEGGIDQEVESFSRLLKSPAVET